MFSSGGAAVAPMAAGRLTHLMLDIDGTLVQHIGSEDSKVLGEELMAISVGPEYLKEYLFRYGIEAPNEQLLSFYDPIEYPPDFFSAVSAVHMPQEKVQAFFDKVQSAPLSPETDSQLEATLVRFFKPKLCHQDWPSVISGEHKSGTMLGICSNTRYHLMARLLCCFLSGFNPDVFDHEHFVSLGSGSEQAKSTRFEKMVGDCPVGSCMVLVDDNFDQLAGVSMLDCEGSVADQRGIRVGVMQFVPMLLAEHGALNDFIQRSKVSIPHGRPKKPSVSTPVAGAAVGGGAPRPRGGGVKPRRRKSKSSLSGLFVGGSGGDHKKPPPSP